MHDLSITNGKMGMKMDLFNLVSRLHRHSMSEWSIRKDKRKPKLENIDKNVKRKKKEIRM